jgi:hypothetical protein
MEYIVTISVVVDDVMVASNIAYHQPELSRMLECGLSKSMSINVHKNDGSNDDRTVDDQVMSLIDYLSPNTALQVLEEFIRKSE